MPQKFRTGFESWGRYPKLDANVVPLNWASEFPLRPPPATRMLPVGAGRSSGDVCLLDHGTLLRTRGPELNGGMDRLLDFDPQTGVLCCEAGTTMGEILDFAVPRGFFLPVSPGTKFVTVGGAIANDIHGKNHHVAGTFGRHVPRFELVRSEGAHLICSAAQHADLYSATIGGMGLTGLITWAEIKLQPILSRKIQYIGIKFSEIQEFVELSAAHAKTEYTVSWLDCVGTGKHFARGIFMAGEHSKAPGPLKRSKASQLTLPFDFPEFLLNRRSVGAFNSLYYNKQRGKIKTRIVDYEPFFYPLDRVLHWNRMYGKSGLLQFQCVLPWEPDNRGIIEMLKAITRSGLASFLAVLKVFGDVTSPGMMSFPKPGLTLALDFPIRHEATFDLVERLAAITLEHKGRIYPAKDATMTAAQFQAFYPQWKKFSAFVDPAFDSAFWQRVTA
ncbi:MAG TPA: FAD-binding oxidoreductase [Acidobacteriaceae bacterium]|nr:FAD-binding oxidoreductase [Acidobacteriaceae bacterium]